MCIVLTKKINRSTTTVMRQVNQATCVFDCVRTYVRACVREQTLGGRFRLKNGDYLLVRVTWSI